MSGFLSKDKKLAIFSVILDFTVWFTGENHNMLAHMA